MKNYSTIYLIIVLLVIGFTSCRQGTEFDGFKDNSYNTLKGQDLEIKNDSLGVDPFLAEKYLSITAKEHRLLLNARKNGMYEIKGVALPEGDNPLKDTLPLAIQKIMFDCSYSNYFYGYPVAIKTNAGILVAGEKRVAEQKVNQFSDNFFVTSVNGGNLNYTEFSKFAPFGLSWNGTRPIIGKTAGGQLVMKGKGLLISDGDFQNWKHYPYAFLNVLNNGKKYKDYGPGMTYSSKFGLFFGTGQSTNDSVFSSLFAVKTDSGIVREVKYKWMPKIMRYDSSFAYIPLLEFPVFYSVERPDLAAYQYDIIAFGTSNDKVYQFVYHYKEGDTFDSIKFSIALTNIKGSIVRQSPVGIDYNPVTKRFEMMHASPYTLDLWSISPDDLLTNKVSRLNVAEWTQEAILLQRDVSIRGQGIYPVSSIIDEAKGTQTVYFYAGQEYPARSGIFELKRTLQTQKLSQFVTAYRAYLLTSRF